MTTYHLVPPPAAPEVPTLDVDQQRVVDHPGGPLLVLAGPGTGKTTTLVEAIARRIEEGASPDQVLALTFSRKAAEQLRDRVTARRRAHHVDGDVLDVPLLRLRPDPPLRPGRALRRAAAAARARRSRTSCCASCSPTTPSRSRWPEALGRALGTRGFAREVHAVLVPGPRARARRSSSSARSGEREGLPELVAAGLFLDQYLTILDDQSAIGLRRPDPAGHDRGRGPPRRAARAVPARLRRRVPGHRPGPGRAAAGARRRRPRPRRGRRPAPVDLRLPRRRGARHPRLPDRVPARRRRARPTWSRCGPPVGSGRALLVASQRVAGRLACPAPSPREAREAFREPGGAEAEPRRRAGRGPHLRHRARRGRAPRRPAAPRPPRGRRGLGRDGGAGPLRAHLDPAAAPRARRGRACRSRSPATRCRWSRDPAVLPLLDALRAVLNLDNDDPDARRPRRRRPGRGAAASPARRARRRRRSGGSRARCAPREKAPAPAEDRPPRPSPRAGPPRGRRRRRSSTACRRSARRGRGPARWRRPARATARARSSPTAATGRGGAVAAVVRHRLAASGCARRRSGGGAGAARPTATSTRSAPCSTWPPGPRSSAATSACATSSATLVAQQIPADTLAERGVRGAAVRLLTAHRAKGLEWRLVVVAHVQQEGWPDLRRRTTLLRADRIGARRAACRRSTARELLVEERRLFYVACTRARERLVVTAVASPDDDGEQPSRFLDELGRQRRRSRRPPGPAAVAGRPGRRAAAHRRRPRRPADAAARRRGPPAGPARRASGGSRPLVPAADPSTWWGTRAATRSVEPVRDPDQPVPVSASMLEAMSVCPAQWFLEREAGGVGAPTSRPTSARSCTRSPTGSRPATSAGPDDVDVLMGHVEEVWGRLFPDAVVEGPRARARPLRARAVPALARRQPRDAARHRVAASRRRSSSTTASGSG